VSALERILKRAQLATIERDEADYEALYIDWGRDLIAPEHDVYAHCPVAGRIALQRAGKRSAWPPFKFRITPGGWEAPGLWVEDDA
jgi:hypothetical protein